MILAHFEKRMTIIEAVVFTTVCFFGYQV